MTPRTRLQRWLTDPFEALALRLALALFGAMSPERASNTGGALAGWLGPKLPLSNRARRNLAYVMPELSMAEVEAIVRGTWENHGRVFGEMAHLPEMISSGRVFAAPDDIARVQEAKGDGRPVIFVGGHLANFEVFGALTATLGMPVTAIYRAPNNPLVDRIWRDLRGSTELVPKSAEGARRALRTLSEKGNLALLIDQKFNEGIDVLFFGKPATTTPAPAHFAERFKAPIVFGWAKRLGPARYQVFAEVVEPAVPEDRSPAARNAAAAETTARINAHLERRVRENPADWFWLHRRWGKI